MHIQISISLSLSCGRAVVLESCRPRSRLCAWPSCYKKPGDLWGSMRAAPRKFDKGNQRYMKDFQHLSKINCMKKLHDDVWCFSSILVCLKELILPWQHLFESTLPPLLSSHSDDPTKLRGNQPGQSSRPCKMRTASWRVARDRNMPGYTMTHHELLRLQKPMQMNDWNGRHGENIDKHGLRWKSKELSVSLDILSRLKDMSATWMEPVTRRVDVHRIFEHRVSEANFLRWIGGDAPVLQWCGWAPWYLEAPLQWTHPSSWAKMDCWGELSWLGQGREARNPLTPKEMERRYNDKERAWRDTFSRLRLHLGVGGVSWGNLKMIWVLLPFPVGKFVFGIEAWMSPAFCIWGGYWNRSRWWFGAPRRGGATQRGENPGSWDDP